MADQGQQQPTARERANVHLRRLSFPEIPPQPVTKPERVAARLRRMGITPVSDQQRTTQNRPNRR
ncbi:hypothetical protein [Micromonospora arida]